MTSRARPDGPPDFDQAENRRQQVRAAGMDPNHWYAVEYDRAVLPGRVVPVSFWGEPVALYRGAGGTLHAVEDRCAHRQLALSLGRVDGDRLTCPYHGWSYDGDGRLADIPHDLFGRAMPKCRLRSYPVRVRYGLVWIFFGDSERAHEVAMPEIPEIEGSDPWASIVLDFTWRAHHSMIIDNVSDFSHAWLHRDYRPFSEARLTELDENGDRVLLRYTAKIGLSRLSSLFIDRQRVDMTSMLLCYQYPYQWSNTDDQIKHWCFVLPIDEHTSKVFFIFYFKSFRVPFTPLRMPRRVMHPIVRIADRIHVRPLLEQDGFAVEAEQRGYERHWGAPVVELNPAVAAFQRLTIGKWREFAARRSAPGRRGGLLELGTKEAALGGSGHGDPA